MRIANRRPVRSAVIGIAFLGLANALTLPGSAARRAVAHASCSLWRRSCEFAPRPSIPAFGGLLIIR